MDGSVPAKQRDPNCASQVTGVPCHATEEVAAQAYDNYIKVG
jgi:hypothetical protein